MKSLVTKSNTTNAIADFEKAARIVKDKLGMHPDLMEAIKIYNELIEVRNKLTMLDDWLKTDADNIEPF